MGLWPANAFDPCNLGGDSRLMAHSVRIGIPYWRIRVSHLAKCASDLWETGDPAVSLLFPEFGK